MEYKLEPRKISKKDLFSLDENNLMFITNPGRMGDEDGLTFVLKKNNSYILYRVDGLLYSNGNDISLDDMYKIFPKWKESWHNYCNNRKNKGKYIYIYMGFGNGLCIDKRIYEKYYPYLIEEIKNSRSSECENDKYDPALVFSLWDDALIKMMKEELNEKKT